MPLMKRKSQKAFEHNIKAEMHAGKSQPQSLAIAYSVKKRAKKASGGAVQSGSRDMNMAEGGSTQKGTSSDWFGDKGKSSGHHFDTIGNYGNEKNTFYRKREAKENLSALSKQKPKLKNLAEGGEISASNERRPMPDNEYHDDIDIRENRHSRDNGQDGWTDRPTEAQAMANDVRGKRLPIKRPKMVPTNAFSTRLYDEEGNLQESDKPGPYGEQPTKWHNEEEAKKSGHPVRDMEDEHSNGRKPYADGGEIGRSADDSEDQPEQEENEEHHNSIAAAIMARRDRLHAEIDSGAHDMDSAVRMADGGILSHDSIYSDDSDVADLSRNHDEDANEEDQLSFNALRKENYNASNLDVDNDVDGNQMGDEEESDSENKHDMISSIRRKMRTKRQFNQD